MSHERFRRTVTFGTLILLGGAVLTDSCSSSPSTCLSPAVVSRPYSGDRTPGVTEDQRTWRLGVLVVTTNPPRDAAYEGLVISFRNSSDLRSAWRSSNPVPDDADQDKRILLGIGTGDVQFEAQIQARAGSVDCQHAPSTTFSEPKLLASISGSHPVWPS